jgi:hypothetical protein
MKKIYEEFSYGKELKGYNYKNYIIEIEYQFTGGFGNTKKWYHVNFKSGQHICFDKLSEAKQAIDNDILV